MNIGDWVVSSNSTGAYTHPDSIGVITATDGALLFVDFEPETLSEAWRSVKIDTSAFWVLSDEVTLAPDEVWRDTRRALREADRVVAENEARELAARQQRISNLRDLHTINLNSANSRYAVSVRSTYTRAHNAEVGGRLASALASNDADDVATALNDMGSGTRTNIYRELSDTMGDLNLCVCDECDYVVSTHDAEEINDILVCQSCKDDNYYYSECMSEYLSADDACSVYFSSRAFRNDNPDDYCTNRYGIRNFESYNGHFVDSDTYYDLGGADDDDDDGDNYSDDGLRDYHSSDRNFVEVNETPSIPALGVELEVYSTSRGNAVSAAKQAVPDDWIFERDGSLSESYGFEIVSQPYGPTEWADIAPVLLDVLRSNNTTAYTQPTSGSYGIHVNLHRRHLTGLQEARMLMFLMSDINRDFVVALAQRAKIYGGDAVHPGSLPSVRMSDIGGLRGKKPRSRGKYSPLKLEGDIAEFRMFQSTLHFPSFMKNLEFIWALTAWTDTKASTGAAFDHKQFIAWLAISPARMQQYPHLIAFLRKPTYMGKGYSKTIQNSWRYLLPTATTKSLDVVTGDSDLRLAA